MAEKERFELSNRFTGYTISSRAPSTKLGDFSKSNSVVVEHCSTRNIITHLSEKVNTICPFLFRKMVENKTKPPQHLLETEMESCYNVR